MAGGLISHKGNGNGHRGRPYPYGLMLVLTFGAALVGVMALHKLRERRIFNLLVDEKNRQLISFQLLLQKERECTKEMKRKAEETKAKIYYLRNHNMELDRRMLEMQSTIDSLRDEQKTMESKLKEKQNMINLLRDEDMDSGNENPNVIALTATLKQKEAEIEDLKQRLKSSIRVWSVGSDDPSNPPVNITVMASTEQKEKEEFNHEEGGRLHESSYNYRGEKSTKGQDGSETKSDFSQKENNREGVEDGSEKTGESTLQIDMTREGQLQNLESLGENDRNEGAMREMKHEYSKHPGSTSKTDGEKNHATATDTLDDMDEQEKKTSFTAEKHEKLKNTHQEGENQKLPKSGKKLEIDENSRISRLPGRFGHLSRTKGKRWKILARNRFLKKNVNAETNGEVESIGSRRFSKEYKEVVRSREEVAVSGEGKAEKGETITGLGTQIDHTKANLFKYQNSEDTEEMKRRKTSVETNDQLVRDNAMSRNHDSFLARVVPENTGVVGEASNYTHDAKQLKVEEAPNIKQNINSRDIKERGKKAQLSSAKRDETEEDTEAADEQEPETEAANGDLSSDFMSNLEDKEGYKEETEESEF
ncbi:hypothetical protein DITRI_Ditri01bG0116000 [Diplodiscus trichospermus]